MRILWINPIGTEVFNADTEKLLEAGKRKDNQVDVISLPDNLPRHLEYHSYEALVLGDIVKLVYHSASQYDAIVIGCFYDIGLREAREVSGRAIVTAPCHAATTIASNLGNSFSILVGRRKWIPKMRENVYLYGHAHRLASMRPVELGVHDFQFDHQRTCDCLLAEGQKAVQEDGAEVIILGCTAEYGFHEQMQKELGVPVIDAVLAPFKFAEFLSEIGQSFGWYPSRMWGSQPPPRAEVEEWGIFQ